MSSSTSDLLKRQRPIDTIVIHCSDSPDDRASVNVREITRWHKERGFKTIGYHFVILRNGTVEIGRPLSKAGAHVQGHNLFSIGICLVGRRDFTVALPTLRDLVKELAIAHDVPLHRIVGHYELDGAKTCPNLDMNAFRESLRDG